MPELLGFLSYVITIYVWIVIVSVVLGWLMAFGVVNPYNPTVRAIAQALDALTEPALRPIRRVMPDLGAVDISPVVLLVALFGVRDFLFPYLLRILA